VILVLGGVDAAILGAVVEALKVIRIMPARIAAINILTIFDGLLCLNHSSDRINFYKL